MLEPQGWKRSQSLDLPAFESSHALAYAYELAKQTKDEMTLLVNLSGRGDKDLAHVTAILAQKEKDAGVK